MDRISEVLSFMREEPGFVSGGHISGRLSISRTAVWKYINQLEKLGYTIEKLKGRGYRLVRTPDKPYHWEIFRHLTSDSIGRKIVFKEYVDSTNSLAYRMALEGEPEGTCIIAETQKSGRGRLSRKWHSPVGKNLYLSIIVRPRIHPTRVPPITFLSSLAVSDTIQTITGTTPTLKWPNDVLINGKKISGTLLELSTEADMVRFVVVGIGFNVNVKETELDNEIRDKATSLFMETKKHFERAYVCGILLGNFEKYYKLFIQSGEEEILRLWEERSQIKGKHLEISQMGEHYSGTAEGIDKDGAILLRINGTIKKIIAGDVGI